MVHPWRSSCPGAALRGHARDGRVGELVPHSRTRDLPGGGRLRKQIPLERIAQVEFDEHITWSDLVFTGWLGWGSPIPSLLVRLRPTKDSWDPSSSAIESLPSVLIAGACQQRALLELRQALNLPLAE